jgi:hypothetical protein
MQIETPSLAGRPSGVSQLYTRARFGHHARCPVVGIGVSLNPAVHETGGWDLFVYMYLYTIINRVQSDDALLTLC